MPTNWCLFCLSWRIKKHEENFSFSGLSDNAHNWRRH